MTGSACSECLRFAAALKVAGAHIEVIRGTRPLVGPSSESGEELIERVGGSGAAGLRSGLEREHERLVAELTPDGPVAAACRHSGRFAWPRLLADDPSPPRVLFAIGDTRLIAEGEGRVAIVGARRATRYGVESARRLASAVAGAGGVVVSGLALGIDGAAHEGALSSSGGRTVAVVAGCVMTPYPRRHSGLHSRIRERGCVISEMPPGSPVWRWSFPARNRLIAALADPVLVVQSAFGSGTIHTADAALERGRSLAAVPGPIDCGMSAGSNRLLADGAHVIDSAATLLELAGLEPVARSSVPAPLRGTLDLVSSGGIEDVIQSDPAAAGSLLRELVELELSGHITRLPGGRWLVVD